MLDIVSHIPGHIKSGRQAVSTAEGTQACATLYDQIMQSVLLELAAEGPPQATTVPEVAVAQSRSFEDILIQRQIFCSLSKKREPLSQAQMGLQQLELELCASDRHELFDEWLSPWERLLDQFSFQQRLVDKTGQRIRHLG